MNTACARISFVAVFSIDTEEKSIFIRDSQVSASVDYPMSLYWRDLARLQPEAKVILTVRDPVRWFHSVRNTIREVNRLKDSWLGAPLR